MTLRARKLAYRPWPVELKICECQADGSVTEVDHRFIGHFNPFTEAEFMGIRADVFGEKTDEEMAKDTADRTMAEQAALDAEFLSRLMCGWELVNDEADQPIVYSAAELKALVTGPDGPVIRRALSRAVTDIRFGIGALKNALTSLAPGPTPAAGEAPTS
jgi:hypothetical protein